MKRRVVVTGLGAITPVGLNVSDMWAAMLAGESGVGYTNCFDTSGCTVKISAEIKNFIPHDNFNAKEARRLDRFIQFSLVAAGEAIRDAKLDISQLQPECIGVYIGSAFGGITTLYEQVTAF